MNFTGLNPGTPRSSGLYQTQQSGTIEIRDVWTHNLASEFAIIRELVTQYPYIAMVRINSILKMCGLIFLLTFRTRNFQGL